MPFKDRAAKAAYDRAYHAARWASITPEDRAAQYLAGRVYTKRYREANHEKRRAYDATRRAEFAAKNANQDARKMGVSGLITAEDVRAVWAASDHCVYCGGPGIGLDHVVPLSRGGPNVRANLVRCCPPCNTRKARRTPEEWLSARNEPTAVSHTRVDVREHDVDRVTLGDAADDRTPRAGQAADERCDDERGHDDRHDT